MTTWQEILHDAFKRSTQIFERVLPNLSQEVIDKQPAPGCNSIGWLAWHASRIQDAQIAALKGSEQLWLADGWATRYGRDASPQDTGFGHSDAEVNSFRSPVLEIVLGYNRAVLKQTEDYISTVEEKTLSVVVDAHRFDSPPTIAVRLVSIATDCTIHAGQAAYLAGLFSRI